MKKGGAKRTKTVSASVQDEGDAFILQDDGGGEEHTSNNRQELAYNDEDEYQDDVDYSGVLNVDNNNTGPKTLLELTRGANEHAAKHIIASKVDHIAVVCYFLLHRLQNSSGGPSPHIFCEQTKEFLMAHPDIKVKAEGVGSRARPYVAEGPPKDILE